ncbi:YqaA family protein [Glaesserella sp.]|uniref:YqaA family protein n=1 Tax=Glaesserella sp. TaxID=2094731 RepID=UPI0035A1B7D3
MIDSFIAWMNQFFSFENQLITMFLSAFLSASLLPGNSEIVFSAFIYQALDNANGSISTEIILLFTCASVGNSLGGLTTYALALFAPAPKPKAQRRKAARWALHYSQKYGIWMLLFSWLPIVGDVLCGVAGWLRFNIWISIVFITIGKTIRYAILFWGIYTLY